MRHLLRLVAASLLAICVAALLGFTPMAAPNPPAASFGADLAFLKQHTSVITLADETGRAQVVVAPAWQGRVMTSTAGGSDGPSFGWINRELIASGKLQPHMNAFGGEDRLWLGPEGGQFSIFFAKGAAFDLEHWFTPPPIDTDAVPGRAAVARFRAVPPRVPARELLRHRLQRPGRPRGAAARRRPRRGSTCAWIRCRA